MNSHQNNGENDMDLNQSLDRLGQRYGQLQQDEPPELLDQAILSSAHRAVEKKPHWMKFGWLHGLTTTAVFVLAFAVVLNQTESPTVSENGIKVDEPVSLQREMVAKKQSLEAKSDDGFTGTKEKNEARQEMLQSVPAAAAVEAPVLESAPYDKTGERESESDTQRVRYVQGRLQDADKRADKDTGSSGLLKEEIAGDEENLMMDAPETGAMYQSNLPSQHPEPAKGNATERAKSDSDVEQKLLEIIKLKQNGDETWRTALESFKETYPDYPLPDELGQ